MSKFKTRSGEPEDDDISTPPELYAELDAEFKFDFDPCPLRASFNGLLMSWGASNYVNPPYNRRDKPKFINKAREEQLKGNTSVLLIPAATGTKQFHDVILPNAEVRFLKGRVRFWKDGAPMKSKGKHDSMVCVFRGVR